ncbi:SAM-dependent methyltransferase [Serinicoccus sp. CNJ-927]|uniref:SAM-dependent methyltransferase n=1 Tax=Serinicoccus sp. CNJ-927 TaxID=1904970 RepID=UPI001EDABD43|nr:SAM-dependent methyltransferase [Serinicoccus sp. CNJ-927]
MHERATGSATDRTQDTSLSWEAAWQEALYGAGGFYRRSAPAAHFATSAQGIPGGGRVLAEAVAALAARHGCDRVVDVGAGRGELLAELRRVSPALHLTGVDVVARPAGLDVEEWHVAPGGTALPDTLRDLDATLLLAHEWLDVVPCPVVQRDGTGVWRTVEVSRTAQGGRWRDSLGAPVEGEELAWVRRWLGDGPEGAPAGPLLRRTGSAAVTHQRSGTASADESVVRAEVGLPREVAFADVVRRVRSGLVVAVDYGHTAEDRPAHGTLTGFRGGRQVDPVPDGSCDLTAHVAVDALAASLPSPTGHPVVTPRRQREVLRDLLGDPSAPVPHALARDQPRAYLDALARRAAARTLSSGVLGDFWWLVVEVDRGRPDRA